MNLMLIIAFLLAVIGKTGFMLDDESKEIIYIEDDNSVSQEKEKVPTGDEDKNIDEFIQKDNTQGKPEPVSLNKKREEKQSKNESKSEPIKNPFDDYGDLADEILDDVHNS